MVRPEGIKFDKDGQIMPINFRDIPAEAFYKEKKEEKVRRRRGVDMGWYQDGEYPYILDTLFPVEGSPCGYGYIDICKIPQTVIDMLDQQIDKHYDITDPRYIPQYKLIEENGSAYCKGCGAIIEHPECEYCGRRVF